MKTSAAAAAALIHVAIFCMHRQWTVHRTGFTPFTLMEASSAYVLRPKLSMYERNADEKRTRNKNIRLDTEDYVVSLVSMTFTDN